MATRIRTARAGGSGAAAAAELATELREDGPGPSLIAVFASTEQPLGEVTAALSRSFPSSTVIGSTTAGEFHGGDEGKGQVVGWALYGEDVQVAAALGTDLKNDPEGAIRAAIPKLPENPELPHRTAILLVDPLSGNGEEAALLASVTLGPNVRLAGGAAGDDLKFVKTEVAVGSESSSDAVVIALMNSRYPPAIGVRHGHVPISPPLTVTRAEGNVLYEFDGKPAFEVWKDAVRSEEEARGVDIDAVDPSELGGTLLRYEVGLIVGANEYKIRAPLSVGEDGSLNCACGIPQGSVVRVTRSVEDDQITSAREAAEAARRSLGDREVAGALVFDCICRNLILGERFVTAVKEIQAALGGAPIAGYETYGEIAMERGQSSGFHNTTTVVLAFPA